MMLYFANGRFKEVSNPRFSDVSVTSEGNLKLIFRKAKNNWFRNVKVSFVASSVTIFFPKRLILNFMRKMKASPWGFEDFLISLLSRQGMPNRGSKLSYDNAKSVLKAAFFKHWVG